MPFVEIKQPKDFVRIKSNGSVTICVTLYRKYFHNKKVKIFHDEEAHLIGLKPSKDGYKCLKYRIKCVPLARITTGEFYPKWSKEHEMLVFSYA